MTKLSTLFPKYWADPVANLAALPTSGLAVGETRLLLDNYRIYAWSGSAWALVYDPLSVSSQLGQPNGIATLDGSSKVPSAQLPSYVDDVLEFADLAALPTTGETGKIYVTQDTNRVYRWSGSSYIEVSISDVNSVNGMTGIVALTTTNIPEGNGLYFTPARAIAALPTQAGNAGTVLGTDGTTLSWVTVNSGGGGGSGLTLQVKSASFTAVNLYHYLIDTSSGAAVTVQLPAAGAVGTQLKFSDARRSWGTTSVTLTPAAGEFIAEGSAGEILSLDISGAALSLMSNGQGRWVVDINTIGVDAIVGTGSGGGGGLTPTSLSAALTATSGKHYLTDTSVAAFIVTLPAGAAGASLKFTDAVGAWGSNKLTLTPASGEKIHTGAANESLDLDTPYSWVELNWSTALSRWVLTFPIVGAGASPLPLVLVNANTQALPNKMYGFTLTTPNVVLTLPATQNGCTVGFVDAAETFNNTNFLTVTPPLGYSISTYGVNNSVTWKNPRASAIFYLAPGTTNYVVQWSNAAAVPPAGANSPGSLKWYEEGTFTPSFTGHTGAATLTYGTRTGGFTRIGNTVFFTIRAAIATVSNVGTGIVIITGLPYLPLSALNYQALTIGYSVGWATQNPTGAILNPSSGAIELYYRTSSVAVSTGLPVASMQANADIIIAGTYIVA